MTRFAKLSLAALAAAGLAAPASAQNLMISGPLGQVHFWVGGYMDGFADAYEAETDVTFTRFYAGELLGLSRGLDGLQSGTADAVILDAPYHAGQFPLSDVTQLPVYGTDSPMITRAFQNLIDSDVVLKDGKTFDDYELRSKGVRGWALGATGAYAISTTGKALDTPEAFRGTPVRAGSALMTMTLENLGVNPVTMPAAQAFEALSRNTIEGILLSVGDWKSYSLLDTLSYTMDGVSLGHWESYWAISDEAWDKLSPEQQEVWDRVAREAGAENAAFIEAQEIEVREAVAPKGAQFVMIQDMSEAMQAFIAEAALGTWRQWVEQTEAAGHPGRATAQLWAELIQAEGAELPPGVAEFLAE